MIRPGVTIIDRAHMLEDYPDDKHLLLKGHDYDICMRLQIGCFVLLAGRLVYLPEDLKNITYTIYQTTKE